VPLDWATTQNNLGIALRALGEQEGGTARLDEAVAAYRAALGEWGRYRSPFRGGDRAELDWAMTQNNLANALATLGKRENRTEWLEEAVVAYRTALREFTRDWAPLQRSIIQNSLGNALSTLADSETGTGHLEEAIVAWEACLSAAIVSGPQEWVNEVRSHIDKAKAEKARRASK
jgi:tetratricopeptide (TPR) repeat protein